MKKVKKLKVLELDKEVIKKLEEAPMNKIQGGGNFCPTGNRWTYCADGTPKYILCMLISRNNFKYAFKNDLT